MSRTVEEIGIIVGGLAIAFLAGPVGIEIFANLALCNSMIGLGLTTALAGTVGLLAPTPQTPSSLSPQGQLAVEGPNPNWRIVYGLFQFGGAQTFIDGPLEDWVGTEANNPCENQYMHMVHTLAAHQIAGFVAVILDGQTYNFGTDLVQLTEANQVVTGTSDGEPIFAGPVGAWGFINPCNPWCGAIWFEFDCGNQNLGDNNPFPALVSGFQLLVGYSRYINGGSTRWTNSCKQQGRAKVHARIHFEPVNNETQGGPNGGPHAYVLGSGRLPTIEYKILGRIITDYRVATAWEASTIYAKYNYVLADGPTGQNIFIQQNSSGTSGSSLPNFSGTAVNSTVTDGSCSWLNCGVPEFALNATSREDRGFGSPPTILIDVASNKLYRNVLMADAWEGRRFLWHGVHRSGD